MRAAPGASSSKAGAEGVQAIALLATRAVAAAKAAGLALKIEDGDAVEPGAQRGQLRGAPPARRARRRGPGAPGRVRLAADPRSARRYCRRGATCLRIRPRCSQPRIASAEPNVNRAGRWPSSQPARRRQDSLATCRSLPCRRRDRSELAAAPPAEHGHRSPPSRCQQWPRSRSRTSCQLGSACRRDRWNSALARHRSPSSRRHDRVRARKPRDRSDPAACFVTDLGRYWHWVSCSPIRPRLFLIAPSPWSRPDPATDSGVARENRAESRFGARDQVRAARPAGPWRTRDGGNERGGDEPLCDPARLPFPAGQRAAGTSRLATPGRRAGAAARRRPRRPPGRRAPRGHRRAERAGSVKTRSAIEIPSTATKSPDRH